MNFSILVRTRLAKLGAGQKDLAHAAGVTESYISQLLGRRKAPPGRDRTDIYPKMETFLGLAPGELARLAELDRTEEIKRRLTEPPEPSFPRFRDLLLEKCVPERADQVRPIFEAQPFGLFERMVAQKMLDVVQHVVRRKIDNDDWIGLVASDGTRDEAAVRVMVLELLDTDVYHVSDDTCVHLFEPLVASWDVDLESLRIEFTLDETLAAEPRRTFGLIEIEIDDGSSDEQGLADFLRDPQLNDGATEEEIRLLRQHHTGTRRPSKLYYYRALQNLRDPLHFFEK